MSKEERKKILIGKIHEKIERLLRSKGMSEADKMALLRKALQAALAAKEERKRCGKLTTIS